MTKCKNIDCSKRVSGVKTDKTVEVVSLFFDSCH